MLITIDTGVWPVLENVEDTKALKISARCDAAALAAAVAPIGRLDGDSHVWVDVRWLAASGRPQVPAWVESFDKMLAYARSRGWLDERGEFVRVHIEYSA